MREEFTRELTAHALPLLRELGRYAAQRAGAPPESIARERFPFWRPPLDKIRAARLLDYLVFDYRPAKYGRSAIAEFLVERGPTVTQPWRDLLQIWQDIGMRLYALEQWSGGFARCRTVLPPADSVVEVMPLELNSAPIDAGAPIALRALPVGSAYVYASWPMTFGLRTPDEVIQALQTRHHDFVRRERIVSLEEFLRLESTAFDEEAAGGSSASLIIVPNRS